jgi:RimJ/RimL family protein N-acetyltransferase
MMDTLMERSNFVQAFQRQLENELTRGQTWRRPQPVSSQEKGERVTLQDGTAVTVRPIQPNDIYLLRKMHRRLSMNTLFYRYLRVYTPTSADLTQICNISDEIGGAYVVTTGQLFERIVAVVYYLKHKQQPDTAEAAFLVEDRFQGRGLGHILWQRLVRHGQQHGITAFEAYVHPDNATMLHLIRKSGLPVTDEVVYDLHEIRVQLKPERALPGFKEGWQ